MKFEIWRGLDRKWRWRFKGANGEIVAGGEGYTRKKDCFSAVMLLKGAADAKISILVNSAIAKVVR